MVAAQNQPLLTPVFAHASRTPAWYVHFCEKSRKCARGSHQAQNLDQNINAALGAVDVLVLRHYVFQVAGAQLHTHTHTPSV